MATKVDPVAAGMSRSDRNVTHQGQQSPPRTGDRYRCDQCGMELEVVADCAGGASGVHLECCGRELAKLGHADALNSPGDADSTKASQWQG